MHVCQGARGKRQPIQLHVCQGARGKRQPILLKGITGDTVNAERADVASPVTTIEGQRYAIFMRNQTLVVDKETETLLSVAVLLKAGFDVKSLPMQPYRSAWPFAQHGIDLPGPGLLPSTVYCHTRQILKRIGFTKSSFLSTRSQRDTS